MLTALYAAAAMLVYDVLCVLLVQAEARDKAALSAALDSIMWLAGIATTTISVSALQSRDLSLKAEVIAAVTVANVVGSYVGVRLGRRYIRTEAKTGAPRKGSSAP